MKFNLTTLIIVFTITFFSSCTIQKRIHQPGYHIEFKKKYNSQTPLDETKLVTSDKELSRVECENIIKIRTC